MVKKKIMFGDWEKYYRQKDSWVNKKTGGTMGIIFSGMKGTPFAVSLQAHKWGSLNSRHFKTRKDALMFVKKYMTKK